MRKPSIAGTWYPAEAGRIEDIFRPWGGMRRGEHHPAALILPHAGYAYSGGIAAEACASVDPAGYRRIIILSPSHHANFPGRVSAEPAGEVETPFGTAVFPEALNRALSGLPGSRHIPEAHAAEHAIDIQLPLLKRFFPECEFGALLVGNLLAPDGADKARALAAGLRGILDDGTLLVISTDFTHYGPRFGYVPFAENVPENMEALDRCVFEALASGSPQAFAEFIGWTGATVCGASPLFLLLHVLPRNVVFTRIDCTSSGRTTGDWSHCVGYTAAMAEVLPDGRGAADENEDAPLSFAAGRFLVSAARRTLNAHFHLPSNTPLPVAGRRTFLELARARGVFVTLTKHGRLRGCIGEILPSRSVLQAVCRRAESAAFEDPRFPGLEAGELGEIHVEVSVLTPPVPVASCGEIIVGRHGVILTKNGRRAVFLPQVAAEQGWDLRTMLSHLSLKAGLPADAWLAGDCSFMVFEAQVFDEPRGAGQTRR